MQRGKGIIGDLRARGGNAANQRRFARVWHAEQADIGEQFQFETQIALLAFRAGFALTRRAVGRAFIAGIAETMKTALRDQQVLAIHGEIANQLISVINKYLRADRHGNQQILTAAAALVTPFAGTTVCRLKTAVETEIGERVDAILRDQIDTAAIAAVTAVRPAERDIFLTAEADDAVAALARADINLSFIYEFHVGVPVKPVANKNEVFIVPTHVLTTKKPCAMQGFERCKSNQASATTLTKRRFSAPRMLKTTLPVAVANSV